MKSSRFQKYLIRLKKLKKETNDTAIKDTRNHFR